MANYVKVTNRKTFQNKIFPELNSKKHTPSPTVWFLRNCVAELRKNWVLQKRNRAILRELTFANDCANCCFFAQNWRAKKEKFCVSFRKNFAKVLRMETLFQSLFPMISYHFSSIIIMTLYVCQLFNPTLCFICSVL